MRHGFINLMTYRYPGAPRVSKGRLFFLHGYGDYSGRYGYWFKLFAKNGYEVVAMDYPKFGKSGGEPRWVWGNPYEGVESYAAFID